MKSSVLLISAVVTLIVGRVLTNDVNTYNLIEDDARVGNGSEAAKGEFPWNVGLYIKSGTGPSFCSGTLLGHFYVLTAAHCVYDAIEIEVVMGAYNITVNEVQQIRMEARDFFIYEDWDMETMKNDIALIKLPRSVHFSTYIKSIDILDSSQSWFNVSLNITGWGKTSEDSELSDVLRYTVVHVVEDIECYNKYGDFYDSSIHFCVEGGAICEGDEGGPLTYYDTHLRSTSLVGVASYTSPEACNGQFDIPTVYTHILTKYYDWINRFAPL